MRGFIVGLALTVIVVIGYTPAVFASEASIASVVYDQVENSYVEPCPDLDVPVLEPQPPVVLPTDDGELLTPPDSEPQSIPDPEPESVVPCETQSPEIIQPPVFHFVKQGVIEVQVADTEPLVLSEVEGVPPTITVEVYANGQVVGRIQDCQLVFSIPFQADLIALHLEGHGSLDAAFLKFKTENRTDDGFMDSINESTPSQAEMDNEIMVEVDESELTSQDEPDPLAIISEITDIIISEDTSWLD